MPFVRATLINNSNHLAVAKLKVIAPAGPQTWEFAANGHSTVEFIPPPMDVSKIDHAGSSVDVLGPMPNTVKFTPSLGGNPGDDIQEAFVYIGRAVLTESIGAWIVNGGAVSWQERNLT